MLVCGTVLIIAPMVHHIITAQMVSELLAKVSKSEYESVTLPAFDKIFWWISAGIGVLCMGLAIIGSKNSKCADV